MIVRVKIMYSVIKYLSKAQFSAKINLNQNCRLTLVKKCKTLGMHQIQNHTFLYNGLFSLSMAFFRECCE